MQLLVLPTIILDTIYSFVYDFHLLKIIISHFRMDFLNNWNFKWLLGPLKIETINQIFEIE